MAAKNLNLNFLEFLVFEALGRVEHDDGLIVTHNSHMTMSQTSLDGSPLRYNQVCTIGSTRGEFCEYVFISVSAPEPTQSAPS